MTAHPRAHIAPPEEPARLRIAEHTVTIDAKSRADDGSYISKRTPTYTVSAVIGVVYRVDHGTKFNEAAETPQSWFARHGDGEPAGPYPSHIAALEALLEAALR